MLSLKALLPIALLLTACDASNPVAPETPPGSEESATEDDSGGSAANSVSLAVTVEPAELVAGSRTPGVITLAVTTEGSATVDEVTVQTTLGFFDSPDCGAQLCTLALEASGGSAAVTVDIQPGDQTGTAEILASAGSAIASAVVAIIEVAPPTAAFSFEVEGMSVQFLNQSTGDDVTYAWDFGDGELCDPCDQHPLHVYLEAKTFVVSLTVSNVGGQAETSQLVTLAPAVDFCWAPVSEGSLTVQFMDLSSPVPETWSWSFGDATSDANSSTIQNPIHTFSGSAEYVVELTITNAGAASGLAQIVCIAEDFIDPPCSEEAIASCEEHEETSP